MTVTVDTYVSPYYNENGQETLQQQNRKRLSICWAYVSTITLLRKIRRLLQYEEPVSNVDKAAS